MQIETAIFAIAVLVFSVIIHEISHGYMAGFLGDPTARLAGRLTLNPAKHLDPLGSIIIPALLALSPGGFIIGWAKPVPYNPYNLKNQRWGDALVSGAGPASNIGIAIIFSIIMRVGIAFGFLSSTLVQAISLIVLINLVLAIFNLIPIPPLDGSKILMSVLSYNQRNKFLQFQDIFLRFGFLGMVVFIFIFIYLLWPFFSAFISFLFTLLTGISGLGI